MTITSAPVLVTGATGFIASQIVERMLAKGYRVRGTLRTLKKDREAGLLRALPGAERLELVEADLNAPGAFDAPTAGCEYVIHTASPYALHVSEPQRDLVDPAVNGTESVLAAAQRAGTVKRIVLTSSMAAITDEPDSGRVLTENDWNMKSSLARNPYYYSKTLAERAAWQVVERNKPPFDLVVINPFLVIGPSLMPALNVSNQIFVDLLNGRYPGIIGLTWGFVDVRDVAEAHVRAMETPAAHGRYICAGDAASMRAVVDLLKRHGWASGSKLPSIGLDNPIGNVVVRLASYFQSAGVGSYLRTHIGRTPRYDTTKIQRELGMRFRSIETTILDTMADLRRWRHIP